MLVALRKRLCELRTEGMGSEMGSTVYVGNMGQEMTEERLKELFETHGDVVDVRVVTDHYTGRQRGFAFVDMATDAAANSAILDMNGQTVDGRQLTVAEAKPRRKIHPMGEPNQTTTKEVSSTDNR